MNKEFWIMTNKRGLSFFFAIALLAACGDSADQPGNASTSPPAPSLPREFPEQIVDYFDAATVHPEARGFQLADYNPRSRQVIFYPWGGQGGAPSSTILTYHADKDFLSKDSYEAVRLRDLIGPDAQGFGAGCIDTAHKWLYLSAFRKDVGNGLEPNSLMIRYDTDRPISDRSSYETFDLSSLNVPRLGWAPCIFLNGYTYFVPIIEVGAPVPPHGMFLRYNSARPFSDPGAWEWWDLENNVNARATGFQSVAAHGSYVYLIPFEIGESLIVRYDTSRPFNSASSYEAFDIAGLNDMVRGPTGGIITGNTLVIVPWRDLSRLPREQSMSVAAAFDTTRGLDDASGWQFFDLTELDPQAKGYQFGWNDRDGFVHFVPTANFEIGGPPPFVVWDSLKPFTDSSSWRTHENTGSPPSTGAAYDPATNTAWMAPYGVNGNSGLITRVRSASHTLSP